MLLETLKSKDEAMLNKNKWMFEGASKYLDGTSKCNARITYITFPRVGNSMIRKYLENITGVITGSEMHPDFSLMI